jgi:hypothetical protein
LRWKFGKEKKYGYPTLIKDMEVSDCRKYPTKLDPPLTAILQLYCV